MNSLDIILSYSAHLTYLYIGLFLVLGSLGLPFPEEIVLISAGYFAGVGVVNFWLILFYVMILLLVVDNLMYYISRKLGREFITKWGHYCFFPMHRLEKFENYYKEHGGKTVFFSRLLIGFRFVGIVVAGITKMPWSKFVKYDLLSIIVYSPIVMGLGYLFYLNLDLVLGNLVLIKHTIFALVIITMLIWFSKVLSEAIANTGNNKSVSDD